MTNETFRMAKQAIFDAKTMRKSCCIGFVRPSNQGKTHTAHIIIRDLGATIIPTMSISEQRNFFATRLERPYFVLDDPSDWYRQDDRQHLFSILKNLISGWLKSGRATRYDYNVPVPLEKMVCVIIFMNEEQYNAIRNDLKFTGLAARMDLYFTYHDEKTLNYIAFEYDEKEYSGQNLPRFKLLKQKDDKELFDKQFLESNKNKRYFAEKVEFEDNRGQRE